MIAAALVLATLGGVTTTAAPVRGHALRWTRAAGAETCIDEAELGAAISARLGRPAFAMPGPRPVIIDGRVAPAGDGWRVSITILAPDGAVRGTRELELSGADCRALDAPLALVLALIVDPDGGGELAIAGGPSSRADRDGGRDEDGAGALRGEVVLAGAAGVGVLPGAGVGGRLAVALDPPHMLPIVLGASWWAPALRPAGTVDGGNLWLQRWQVGLSLCTPSVQVRSVALAGCAGGELGRLTARGVGFAQDRTTRSTLALAAAGGRATVELGPHVFAALAINVHVPLVRPRVMDGADTVLYRVPAVAVVADLGAGVRF